MSTATMAARPQEAIQQGSTQPETTKPDKYSISTAEALREGYSVPGAGTGNSKLQVLWQKAGILRPG